MNELLSEPELKFDAGDNKEYRVEAIIDNAVYAKEVERYLLGLYYLIFWKGYTEEERTWELFFTVIQFRKMISIFHKDYPEKQTAIFFPSIQLRPWLSHQLNPPSLLQSKSKAAQHA